MAEDINIYEKFLKPKEKPKPDDTRAEDGKYQTTAEWMRRGGKNPDVIIH